MSKFFFDPVPTLYRVPPKKLKKGGQTRIRKGKKQPPKAKMDQVVKGKMLGGGREEKMGFCDVPV